LRSIQPVSRSVSGAFSTAVIPVAPSVQGSFNTESTLAVRQACHQRCHPEVACRRESRQAAEVTLDELRVELTYPAATPPSGSSAPTTRAEPDKQVFRAKVDPATVARLLAVRPEAIVPGLARCCCAPSWCGWTRTPGWTS